MSGISVDPGHMSFGVYLKLGAYPTSETALIDLDSGAAGYARLTLGTAGMLTFDSNLLRPTTWHSPSNVSLGTWSWVVFAGRVDGSNSGSFYWQAGAYWAGVWQWSVGGGFGLSPPYYPPGRTCVVSFGTVAQPGSAIANFRKDPTFEMSAGILGTSGYNGLIWPPSGYWGTQGAGIYVYNGKQQVGAATSLQDASGNGVDLPAGPQGLQIIADGPF